MSKTMFVCIVIGCVFAVGMIAISVNIFTSISAVKSVKLDSLEANASKLTGNELEAVLNEILREGWGPPLLSGSICFIVGILQIIVAGVIIAHFILRIPVTKPEEESD